MCEDSKIIVTDKENKCGVMQSVRTWERHTGGILLCARQTWLWQRRSVTVPASLWTASTVLPVH